MAVPGKEIELLTGGTNLFEYDEGSFVQNMMFKRNSWVVRGGFGQRAQYDTSFLTRFADAPVAGRNQQGLNTHLGSTLFEHGEFRQIVSVFSSWAYGQDTAANGKSVFMYVVQIYDLNTQERWEEPLYIDTSKAEKSVLPLSQRHAIYETTKDQDYQSWRAAIEAPFFFTKFEGRLYFGSQESSLFVYSPTTYRGNRAKPVNTTFASYWTKEHYGESSVVREFHLTTGDVVDVGYLESHEIGSPVGAAPLFRRLAFADRNNLYISDIDVASAFKGRNTIPIPGGSEIRAIASHLGSVLIWTQNEMWRFTPPDTQIVSNGSLVKVSETVGCVGQMAVQRVEDSIVWVDESGVYTTSNGLAIKEISGPIRPFFDSFITNPFTSYYTEAGATDLSNIQPTTTMRYKKDFIHVAHSTRQRALYVGFPMQGIGLCFTEGQWSVWTFESVVKLDSAGTPASEVGVQKNIMTPWLVADEERFYCIGSIDSQTMTDNGKYWNGSAWVDTDLDVGDRSYYVLEQGRGGAIDRSVDNEDYRQVRGEWRREQAASGTAWGLGWVFGKWERIPTNYAMPSNSGGFSSVISATDEAYWVPVSIWDNVPAVAILGFSLSIYFDSNNWEPIFTSATSAVPDFVVANERIPTAPGFKKAAPAAGTEEVQCYNAGGAVARDGQEIRIRWTFLAGAIPSILTPPNSVTPLLFLPFKRKNQANGVSGLQIQKGSIFPAADGLIAWEQWSMGTSSMRKENNVAQPVDWAYKSPQVGLDDDKTYKARGLYIRMESSGKGHSANFLDPNWLYGPLNTLLGSDMKGWSSQIIDYVGDSSVSQDEAIKLIQDKTTIRTRVQSGSSLVEKVFGNAQVTYGNPASATAGTLLIDDKEMNTMATSDNVRGQSFSYMLFGHMQDKAQGIALDSVKAVFRLLGNRHRYGR